MDENNQLEGFVRWVFTCRGPLAGESEVGTRSLYCQALKGSGFEEPGPFCTYLGGLKLTAFFVVVSK